MEDTYTRLSALKAEARNPQPKLPRDAADRRLKRRVASVEEYKNGIRLIFDGDTPKDKVYIVTDIVGCRLTMNKAKVSVDELVTLAERQIAPYYVTYIPMDAGDGEVFSLTADFEK
jgi:hypothetical protein